MEINPTRRIVLRGAGSIGAVSALMMAGLLKPTAVYAADWNKAAFEAKDTGGALKALGAGTPAEHKDLTIKVPDIAENGAVVPVDVVSNIPNTSSIAIMVDKNPTALTSQYNFANGALAEVSARIKMGQTSVVRAVAKAGDKFYVAQKECKVTVGGCGG
jgi:sulfur-oxidizing protein SoxY